MVSDPKQEPARITFHGGQYGEPDFEYFATIGARNLTAQEYEQLTDEEKAQIASRPDLYEDAENNDPEARKAARARERRNTARRADTEEAQSARDKASVARKQRRSERTQRTTADDPKPSTSEDQPAETSPQRRERDTDDATSEAEE